MLERDDKSPKPHFLSPPSLVTAATTQAAVCNPLPVPCLTFCPFPLYIGRKIPTLIRSPFLIHEVAKFRFAWMGTVPQELGTRAQLLMLPSSSIQVCRSVHLILAFSTTTVRITKDQSLVFQSLKKKIVLPFKLQLHKVFLMMAYRHISGRI